MVHRMLMYATICKSVNNIDVTISQDDYRGFYPQLRGWWDNYMPSDCTKKEDACIRFILTILEHFSGRFTNQYETIRSLLNGLKCRHLGEFRWYKDTYLSRSWNFPKMSKKDSRNPQGIIPYSEFTYGKLIGLVMQEGIFVNELKLSDKLRWISLEKSLN
ncbi:hypothetical protein H5410_023162 [Solanum commersonii]|uniref:DUF7746 domain-containing protein n=1 Tax=Solanum commersonii TaxID=4109 RepID=A0A9J5ZG30_SOLCO|nr:hypothetical protein H5410_023162 [Solanum commersonii]